jgi:catechol 2,3-dioxygenase-like lactoylglutathione lyase family enzyme
MVTMEHTGLVVKDLDKQLTFYRDTLGMKVIRESSSIAPPGGDHTGVSNARRKLVFLGTVREEHQLELIYYIDPQSPPKSAIGQNQVGSIHLCFKTDNVQDLYDDLLKQGIRFLTPPRVTQGNRSILCYGQDPEENWIEFKQELINP